MQDKPLREPMTGLQKFLIFFGIAAAIGLVFLIAIMTYVCTKIIPIDPRESEKLAQSVFKIDKLPRGFERTIAMSIDGIAYVEYRNTQEKLVIKVVRDLDQHHLKWATAEDIVHNDPQARSGGGLERNLIDSGTKTVGGERMFYQVIELKQLNSRQMIAGVVTAKTHSSIQFDILSAFSKKFNMEQTDAFLDSIKGF